MSTGEFLTGLLPAAVGLLVTPAAIIGCVLLLQSKRPVANAGAFAAGFLADYLVVAGAALLGGAGRQDPTAAATDVKNWISLLVGALFLLGGLAGLRRRPARSAAAPKWMTELENAGPRRAFLSGVALSLVNPNVFILLSGLSVVTAADVSPGVAVLGTVVLLVGCALDFVIPVGLFVLLGERARQALDVTRAWMLRHSRALGTGVLLVFGVLFLVRGLTALL
jgi:Sap, sulfolipid-1-addressing protein